MAATDWTPIAQGATRALEELDEVARRASAAIRERIPDYQDVSEAELTKAVTRNLADVLVALRDRRLLTPVELEDFTLTVEERALNRIGIDDYLLAVAIGEAELWDAISSRAGELTGDQRAEANALRLGCMNLITRVTASAHRRIELDSVRRDQERRAEAMRALMRGALSRDEAHEQLARLGLADEHQYVVVRARARVPVDVPRLLAAPDSAFVLWGEDTVGVARVRPAAKPNLTIAVAGPVPVGDLPLALDRATTVFEAAWALSIDGVSDLASLGIRAAVQAFPDLGAELRRRYLEPLGESGSLADELLTTARVFLESGGRRDDTASALHLHVNTVAYRLRRFAELTGAELSDLTTVAELHWLFADLDLRP